MLCRLPPVLIALTVLGGGMAHAERRSPAPRRSADPRISVQLTSGDGLWVRSPSRAFGRAGTVRLLRAGIRAVRQRFSGTPALPVGDLSRRGGGRLRPHRSHRDGRDADVGYYFTDGRERRWFAAPKRKTFDVARQWALFEHWLKQGVVKYLFVSYPLQAALYRHALKHGYTKKALARIFQWPRHHRKKAGIIRLEWGHHDHFHVRFTQSAAR